MDKQAIGLILALAIGVILLLELTPVPTPIKSIKSAVKSRSHTLYRRLVNTRRARKQRMQRDNPESSNDPKSEHSVYPF